MWHVATRDNRIDVHVLTGFLGSGKTTLLRQLLLDPRLLDTAILINEFGTVGIDHLLTGAMVGDVVLLGGGCVCCSIRGDVANALRDLWVRRAKDELPPFRRVIIETTGLADPFPVMATVAADIALRHHFRPGKVITMVDAVNGIQTLKRFPESIQQVKAADSLFVTKCDIAQPQERLAVRALLQSLNPLAGIKDITQGVTGPEILLEDIHPSEEIERAGRWINSPAGQMSHNRITGCVIEQVEEIGWADFGLWFSLLAHRHGERILRMKGIFRFAGGGAPVLIQAAQHLVHRPEHLTTLPNDSPAVAMALITEGIEHERLRRSFSIMAGRRGTI